MTARVDRAVTSGTFSLDGQTFDVDNNVWVIGDDHECVILDAPHDVAAILALVGDRQVRAILATHAHDDHVRVAPELAEATGAPVLLHAEDRVLWDMVHPHLPPHGELHDGQSIEVGGTTLWVLHTPGTAPARAASTRRSWARCSPATRSSLVARARRAARTATSTPSSGRSAPAC